MAKKNVRVSAYVDAETSEYLKQKSIASGAAVGELIRRAVNMQRFADQGHRRIETRGRR